MKTREEIIRDNERYDDLVRRVFVSPDGQELLAMMQKTFVEGPIYDESERATVYALAQRDFVLELKSRLDDWPRNNDEVE